MFYITMTVLANTIIFILFKLFDRYHIDTFQAIVVNYLFAFIVATSLSNAPFDISQAIYSDWIWGAICLGFMFIVGFYLVAITTQKLGMSVVAISSKMSVAIPVVFGIIVYSESTEASKIIGILMAIAAVYLSSYTQTKLDRKIDILLPIVLFFSSGVLDTTLKYMQTYYIPSNQTSQFLSIVFLLAGLLGFIFLLYKVHIKQTFFALNSIYSGLLLGFINYLSMYFLLKALQSNGIESATVFTTNNVSIVMLSTIIGVWLFSEKLLKINIVGLVLAIIAISIITLT